MKIEEKKVEYLSGRLEKILAHDFMVMNRLCSFYAKQSK